MNRGIHTANTPWFLFTAAPHRDSFENFENPSFRGLRHELEDLVFKLTCGRDGYGEGQSENIQV